MDVLSPEQRRFNMSKIKGRDTKPEMQLRKGLYASGFRYRLHVGGLPGKPDIVFRREKAVIFVHGCFWHSHQCALSKMPKTRAEFWSKKLIANSERDIRNVATLRSRGWRVLTVWECALRGVGRRSLPDVLKRCAEFIEGQATEVCLAGKS